MTVEYLATSSPPRQRRPWVAGLGIVLLLAVVGGFLLWSDHVKSAANETLSSAVADAQEQARIGEGRVMSTLTYAMPMIWSQEVPETVRAGLRALVQESAAAASANLGILDDEVASTLILPWQRAQSEARDRVRDLILAEQSRFDRIADDARQLGPVLAQPRPSDAAARLALSASGAD